MAYLRLSRAKYRYECFSCSRVIPKGTMYYRDEPHPMARIKRGEKARHICSVCVLGEDDQGRLRDYWVTDSASAARYEQLELALDEPVTILRTEVEVINVSSMLVRLLSNKPDELYRLSEGTFEELICDRFENMGYTVARVGGHVYHKDGGIDIVAWPERAPFPFLLAIQAKHHRSPRRKAGPGPVRELLGVVETLPFSAGVLVTNTTFTPDAKWLAELRHGLVRLRDVHDVQRWLRDEFLDECDWREMPGRIELCPGVTIEIPQPRYHG